MTYSALTIGLADDLLMDLQIRVSWYDLSCTICATVQEAGRLLNSQIFHLLIVDLEYLRSIQQIEWLGEIRRITFVPVIVLSDTPEKDVKNIVHLGADMCISGKSSYPMIAELAFAQLRRYTAYNHYNAPEVASFRGGDVFIDPARRIVEVCGRPVSLRPREFSLLLYFMQNPNIVLSSEQICEHAWGMEGSYNQGISGPIAILRKAIEPDPAHPKYIETVSRIGYRFTAYHSETCDICSSSGAVL